MEKVLFKTKEEAESKTGYFSVSSLMITSELCEIIDQYISRENLLTWCGNNIAETCRNTFTLNFTLQKYNNGQNPRSYISTPGALGNFNHQLETKRVRVNPGRPDSYVAIHEPSGEIVEEFKSLSERTPTLEQMYFWIVRKYPSDILWMKYATERGFGPEDDEEVPY